MIQAETEPKQESKTEPKSEYWFKVASRYWDALEKRDYLVLRYQNLSDEKAHNEKVKWANELERVERIDGVDKGKVVAVLDWLLRVNTFWVRKGGPLQSLGQLRATTSRGTRKIDTILSQYDEWVENKGVRTKINLPQKGDKFTAFQYKQLIESYPELASKLKKFPINEANQEYICIA